MEYVDLYELAAHIWLTIIIRQCGTILKPSMSARLVPSNQILQFVRGGVIHLANIVD